MERSSERAHAHWYKRVSMYPLREHLLTLLSERIIDLTLDKKGDYNLSALWSFFVSRFAWFLPFFSIHLQKLFNLYGACKGVVSKILIPTNYETFKYHCNFILLPADELPFMVMFVFACSITSQYMACNHDEEILNFVVLKEYLLVY